MSSVLVAWTRTFLPLMSSTDFTSCLLYMLRMPMVSRPSTCAPCTWSLTMARNSAAIAGSASAFCRCAWSRNRKWSENTPACGASVDALAVDVMTKSMSPARSFCSICGSWPSWPPGNWLMLILPPESSFSLASKMLPAMP